MKEFQRSIGKDIKSILEKFLDDSLWSFYAKKIKKYIGTLQLNDYEFKVTILYLTYLIFQKFSIRGLNSEDEVFVLTLGLKDPEALRKQNEQVAISTYLLPVSLQNYSKRFQAMQVELMEIKEDNEGYSQRLMLRTIESLNFQTEMLKEIAARRFRIELEAENKPQDEKGEESNKNEQKNEEEIEFHSFQIKTPEKQKEQQPNFNFEQNKQGNSQKNTEDKYNGKTTVVEFKTEDNFKYAEKHTDTHTQRGLVEVGNKHDNMKDQLNLTTQTIVLEVSHLQKGGELNKPEDQPKSIQDVEQVEEKSQKLKAKNQKILKEFEIIFEEQNELDEYLDHFYVKDAIQEVQELYANEIEVLISIDNDLQMRAKQRRMRALFIALFENCLQLKKKDNIDSTLKFSQPQGTSNEFCLEIKFNETQKYNFESQQNKSLSESKETHNSQIKIFRFLNGINHPLIQSLEFQNMLNYCSQTCTMPISFTQDKSNQIKVIFIFRLEPLQQTADSSPQKKQNSNSQNEELFQQENQIFSQFLEVNENKNNELNSLPLLSVSSLNASQSNQKVSKAQSITQHRFTNLPKKPRVPPKNSNKPEKIEQIKSLQKIDLDCKDQSQQNILPKLSQPAALENHPNLIKEESQDLMSMARSFVEEIDLSSINESQNTSFRQGREIPTYEERFQQMRKDQIKK